MIVSHIYLLIGCALPLTLSFILFGGGLLNSEFTTISLSGVIFLGIGDVCAALYGRAYGCTKWYEGCNKTVEGSKACWFSTLLAYLIVCCMISPMSYDYYISYFISCLIVTIVEAFTSQFDNLICTVVYFIALT